MLQNNKKLDVQIIFCDLDHTLVGIGQETTTPQNMAKIKTVKAMDKEFVIATGRSLERSLVFAEKLQLNYHIASNGGLIYSLLENKVLRANVMKNELLKKLLMVFNLSKHFSLFTTFYCINENNQLASFCWGTPNSQFYEQKVPLSHFQSLKNEQEILVWKVFRINIYGPTLDLQPFDQHLTTTDGFSQVFNYPTVLEINSNGINKGTAASFLTKWLQIDQKQTMGFGDGFNDLDIFRFVQYGIAVANAKPELKALSFVQTTSYEQSGVATALTKWVIPDSD